MTEPTVKAAHLKGNLHDMNHNHRIMHLSPDFIIGRGTLNEVNVCLMDVNISRKHCQFNHENDVWTITDLSSNGVWVNGVRIAKNSPIKLQDKDNIVLSDLKHLYNWSFNIGDEERGPVPTKKIRLNHDGAVDFDTQTLDVVVSEIRKLAEVRILREELRLEQAAKASSRRLATLEEERLLLISRLEEQSRQQIRKEIESRELFLQGTKDKVDKDTLLKEFEERMRMEKEKSAEQRKAIVDYFEQKMTEEEAKRSKEIQEKEIKLSEMNREKIDREEKVENERKKMEEELRQLQDKLKEENTSKDVLEKEWQSKLCSLTCQMEETINKEKEEMEKAVNKEKLEKENLEKEMDLEKTQRLTEVAKLQEDLQCEKSSHATALEFFKRDHNSKLAESLEREYRCPTCLDVFIAPVSLNCGHTYCWLCLAQWKNSNGRTRGDLGTCPECREVVKHENRVIAIDHMIDAIMEQLGEEKKRERTTKVKERKEEEERFKASVTVSGLATANRSVTLSARGRGGATVARGARGHNASIQPQPARGGRGGQVANIVPPIRATPPARAPATVIRPAQRMNLPLGNRPYININQRSTIRPGAIQQPNQVQASVQHHQPVVRPTFMHTQQPINRPPLGTQQPAISSASIQQLNQGPPAVPIINIRPAVAGGEARQWAPGTLLRTEDQRIMRVINVQPAGMTVQVVNGAVHAVITPVAPTQTTSRVATSSQPPATTPLTPIQISSEED